MVELLEVVVSRYNRSQRTAMTYHLALMELAGRISGPRVARGRVDGSKLLAQPLAAQLAVERPRPAAVEAAFERRGEIVEREAGDVGQVQLARLGERRPDELDQLRLRVNDALDAPSDGARVDHQKARVEAPRPGPAA